MTDNTRTRSTRALPKLPIGDGRLVSIDGVPASPSPSTPFLCDASQFVFSSPGRAGENASARIPIGSEGIRAMREKLLRLDEAFNKFIASTSKATVDTKTMLQNWQVGYQTAINSLIVAYTSVTEQLLTTESCQSAVVRTCTGITRNCIASVKEASERVISAQPVPASYAEKVKLAPKVHIPRGPTVQVPKTTTFIVALTPEANVDFATSLMTKDALMKAVRL